MLLKITEKEMLLNKRKKNGLIANVVRYTAVFRVVTQRSSPLTAVSGEGRCVTTLIGTLRSNDATAMRTSLKK